MIVALLLMLAQAPSARVALAQVEIDGPRARLELELAGAGRAELELAAPSSAGERRRFVLAVPLPPGNLPPGIWSRALSDALDSAGGCRLVELSASAGLEALSPELLARPRPVLAPRAPRLSWSSLFVLGAAFSITLSQRRRVRVVVAIAVLACGSIIALTLGLGSKAVASVRILEARFDAARGEPWLAVEASLDRLDRLEPGELGVSRIEVEPRNAPILCRTRSDPPLVSLESPGATIFRMRAFDPGARRISREINAFGDFDQAWFRDSEGPWFHLGPWRLGEAMPARAPGEPPGWLVPALPMGSSIFLGRLASERGSRSPPEPSGPSTLDASTTWVRGLGL